MAQNDHSSQPSSKALWFIIPIAIGLSLLLTNLHHTEPRAVLPGHIGDIKKVEVAPAAADTMHKDTTHTNTADHTPASTEHSR
jgi:hypothetical protein